MGLKVVRDSYNSFRMAKGHRQLSPVLKQLTVFKLYAPPVIVKKYIRFRNPIPISDFQSFFFRCSPSESESVSITNAGSGRHTGLPLQFKLPTICLRSVFPVVDPELFYPQSHDPLGEAELCYGILFACYIRNKITMAISFFYCFWIWGRGEKEVFFIDYSDLFCLLPLIVLITEASSLFLLLVAMLVFFRFMRL